LMFASSFAQELHVAPWKNTAVFFPSAIASFTADSE